MNETIKKYFSDHWIAMLFSLATSSAIYIVALITMYVNYRVDILTLKQKVDAQTTSLQSVVVIHQEILQKESAIQQKQTDEIDTLVNLQSDMKDIHDYFLGTKK